MMIKVKLTTATEKSFFISTDSHGTLGLTLV